MSDIKEIAAASVNAVSVAQESGHDVLHIALKPAYRDKPQLQRYLRREFQATRELQGPHILRTIELREDPDGPIVVTEWADVVNLSTWLRDGHSREERLELAKQVIDAVGELHEQGFVSGQLNADNILLTRQHAEVRILPFRLRYPDILKQPKGQLQWLAPEVKDGTVAIDARADIYSLGVLLKEAGLQADYPQIVGRCMSFGRNERYDSTDELQAALSHRRLPRERRADEDEASSAPSSMPRKAIVIAIVVAILAVGALVWRQVSSSKGTAQSTETVDSLPQHSDQAVAGQPSATAQPAEASAQTAVSDSVVSAMQAALDQIYATRRGPRTHRRQAVAYYRATRRQLQEQGLSQAQLDAFDQAFADYNHQKQAETPAPAPSGRRGEAATEHAAAGAEAAGQAAAPAAPVHTPAPAEP